MESLVLSFYLTRYGLIPPLQADKEEMIMFCTLTTNKAAYKIQENN